MARRKSWHASICLPVAGRDRVQSVGVARGAPLLGRGIVVTRPQEQSQTIARLIRERGGRAIVFPAIEISPAADQTQLHAIVDTLDAFDMAIFISPVAVDRAMSVISARRTFPAGLAVAAVGQGGVRALERHGIRDVIAPARAFDSEALLDCAELENVAGKRVVIFRGDGGRDLIARTLSQRGATVEYAQCYRRSAPSRDVTPLIDAWNGKEIDAFIITSSEALRNLHTMLRIDPRILTETPLFVPHRRIADTARELGLGQIVETASGDEAMLQALLEHFSEGGS